MSDQKPAQRMDLLDKWIGEATERAASIKKLDGYLERLDQDGLTGLIAHVEAAHPLADQYFMIRATLGAYLGRSADWDGKLGLLLDLVDREPDAQSLVFIDEVIAEIFDGGDAVQEMLGVQRNLAAALRTMIQLSAGTYEISERSHAQLERFSAAMAVRCQWSTPSPSTWLST